MSKPINQSNREERRKLIKQQLLFEPALSNRCIARRLGLGISHVTVGDVRKELLVSGQINHLDTSEDSWINEPYFSQNKSILDKLTNKGKRAIKDPKVRAIMIEKKLTSPVYAQRLLHKEKLVAQQVAYQATLERLMANDIKLTVADICDGLPHIPDHSVNAIICDAMYSKDYLDTYEALSLVASRILTDNGVLVCLTGTSWLPEVIEHLGKHLRYWWQAIYLTPSASPNLPQKRVYTKYKPLLIYVREDYKGPFFGDVIKAPPDKNDKEYYEYSQSIDGFVDIIQRFTNPGDLVMDPFVATGCTALAALQCGRKFWGSDINVKRIEITRQRVEQFLKSNTATDINE